MYVATYQNVTLENNLILDNTVTEDAYGSAVGGGIVIENDSGGNYTIRNNVIAGNTAQGATWARGGGLYIGWSTANDVIHVVENTIYGNQASKGGGVYFSYAKTVNV